MGDENILWYAVSTARFCGKPGIASPLDLRRGAKGLSPWRMMLLKTRASLFLSLYDNSGLAGHRYKELHSASIHHGHTVRQVQEPISHLGLKLLYLGFKLLLELLLDLGSELLHIDLRLFRLRVQALLH